MAKTRDSLDLDGDDAAEVLYRLEDTFDIKITDDEGVACATVADVLALIRRKLPERDGVCMTAMTFYRLRRVLAAASPDERLRPTSDLAPFARKGAKALLKDLKQATGLTMPQPLGLWRTNLGWVLIAVAFLAVPLAAAHFQNGWLLWTGVVLWTGGGLLMRVDPGGLTKDTATLRGLSEKVAVLNYGRLVSAGAAVRTRELDAAVIEVLADQVDIPPSEVTPQLRLLMREPKAA